MGQEQQRRARSPRKGSGFSHFWPRPHRWAPAFTLIELIAVVIIIAILSGVAAASLDSVSDRNVRFAAAQTVEHMRAIRQRAMTVGHPMWITFDINADTFEIREDDPNTPGFLNSTVFADPLTGKPAIIDVTAEYGGSVDLTVVNFNGQLTIGFDWLGTPMLSDGSRFILEYGVVTFNTTVNVRVYGDTGYATVE